MPCNAYLDYDYNQRVRFGWDLPPHPRLQHMISARNAQYRDLLREYMSFQEHLRAIPITADRSRPEEPCWGNGWLPGLDAVSIYGLLVKVNPATYLEVGSGNSTKFARRAIRDYNLRTRIISIDPYPRAEIDDICDVVVRRPLEETNLSRFFNLEANDVVFIDNSHRSFQNSDVTVVFTEILPELPLYTIVGLHDIFLPYDYPKLWADNRRFYNEQYLLASYLLGGGGGYDIFFPSAYVAFTPELRQELWPLATSQELRDVKFDGGAFWLRRVAYK